MSSGPSHGTLTFLKTRPFLEFYPTREHVKFTLVGLQWLAKGDPEKWRAVFL